VNQWVYYFGDGKADGNARMKKELGGKGANLAEMTNLGLPIPPGFTIAAGACRHVMTNSGRYPDGLKEQIRAAVTRLEASTGRVFGGDQEPLLVSVRSGAAVSMPGMMDTVLNLGLNRTTVAALVKVSGDERFALDCWRRFLQMYGNVVLGVEMEHFESRLEALKEERKAASDTDLVAADWQGLVDEYHRIILEQTGEPFPEDPWDQLWGSVDAVFKSWNNKRAESYRRIHGIPSDLGTGVNVQAMVFGNLGENCATGVAFTRDPGNGEKLFYGEWLPNAQGEDVVAGIRTPRPVNKVASAQGRSLEEAMPEMHAELVAIAQRLEQHYRDMQDLEFTIQHGRLYMLQTRSGKRTGLAAVRIAVEMVDEGLITREQALQNVSPDLLVQLLAPVFPREDQEAARREGRVLAKGLPAGPGSACGRVVLSAEKAVDMVRNKGERVLLVRTETSPEDIEGMEVSQGILTTRGGMTSHAAVVARGRGKACIVGCGDLVVDARTKQVRAGETIIKQGDWISIDGTTGEVIVGELPTRPSEIVQVLVENSMAAEDSRIYRDFSRLMEWAGETRRLKVRTNADDPADARVARLFGAEGIGLCRTEHMFFEADRIRAVRQMILASTEEERRRALALIEPLQRQDFEGILKAMEGLPVTIRLLDPPLHEFLPQEAAEIETTARDLGVTTEKLRESIEHLHELNPMLGHRGCRLGLSHPEIYEVQVRAIFTAACALQREKVKVLPEVMIPLVGTVAEFRRLRRLVLDTAEDVMSREGVQVAFLVGTMIEIPRACLVAGGIAAEAEFFSFGTNDLTQMGFGFSRDDIGSFLPGYLETGVLSADPFQSLDQEGIGQLVEMAVKARTGLDYVSCSPYRVPVASLAAARIVLSEKAQGEEPLGDR
jgi:pyruvate,orthophosphate dikinase